MVDTETLREVVPHYVAMLVVALLVLSVARTVVGELGFWLELAVGFAVVATYRIVVGRLGYLPDSWTS
jgi:hypothetical protein